MRTSDAINELAAALAKAAEEFPTIQRNCEAKIRGKDDKPGRVYHYADLDDVLSAVRKPLAKNGLTLSHDCRVTDQPFVAFITARLEHSSGQWKETEPMPMPCEGFMSAAQQIGSANTYGKRYTSQNILGISTESDDDGAAAGGLDDMDTGRRAPKPACPECGKPDHVYEDRQKGGFFCWKTKGGCGHNWLPNAEQAEPTKANGHTPEVPAQAGLKTGAEVEAAHRATYQRAVAAINKATADRDKEKLDRISAAIAKDLKEGNLNKTYESALVNELAIAADKIEASEREPIGAA